MKNAIERHRQLHLDQRAKGFKHSFFDPNAGKRITYHAFSTHAEQLGFTMFAQKRGVFDADDKKTAVHLSFNENTFPGIYGRHYFSEFHCSKCDLRGAVFDDILAISFTLFASKLQAADLTTLEEKTSFYQVRYESCEFDMKTRFKSQKQSWVEKFREGFSRKMFYEPGRPWTNEEFVAASLALLSMPLTATPNPENEVLDLNKVRPSGFINFRNFLGADLSEIDPQLLLAAFGSQIKDGESFIPRNQTQIYGRHWKRDRWYVLLPEKLAIDHSLSFIRYEP